MKSTVSSSIQVSSQPLKGYKPPAPLPRVINSATDKFTGGDEYVLCDLSLTPAEVAAENALKNRGPPPKPPEPYQKSRSLSRSGGHNALPNRHHSCSDLESSPGSSLQEAPSTSALKPPPRRKHTVNKPRTNKQLT